MDKKTAENRNCPRKKRHIVCGHYVLTFVTAIVAIVSVASCGREKRDETGALYSTDSFTVWPDSMVVGERLFVPESLGIPAVPVSSAVSASPCQGHPAMPSPEGPVMSGSDTLLAFMFNRPGKHFQRFPDPLVDPCGAIEDAVTALDSLDTWQWNGIRYPVISFKAGELAYVADVCTATGSPALRQRLLRAAVEVIGYERDKMFCDSLYLFKGIDMATLRESACPPWMDAADMASSLSFAGNIAHARLLGFLADELQGDDAARYGAMRDSLINSIDTYFWIPDRGRYSRLVIGYPRPCAVDDTDMTAEAMAAVWGISSDAIVRAMASAGPMLEDGVPDSWPLTSLPPSVGRCTTALWCALAGRVADTRVMSATIASLCRLFDGYGMKVAMLRGVAGISALGSDRLTFAPCVPECLGGEIRIDGLCYRDAVLSVRIHGTGNIISTFSVDGVAQPDHSIPATVSGAHTVDITLVGREGGDDRLTISPPVTVSWSEKPVPAFGPDSLTVKFTDFARPYARSLKDRKLAHSYVESTRYRNRSLRFEVDAPRAGDYFFTISFINGEGIVNPGRQYALRTLSVNEGKEEIIVFPQLSPDRWRHDLDWQSSTGVTLPLKITLHEGINRLSLDYFDPGIMGFNHDANTLIPISATLHLIPAAPPAPKLRFR